MVQAESAAVATSGGRASLLSLLCLTGAGILWGTSYIATKYAIGAIQPPVVMWLRMTIASVIAATFWGRLRKPDRRPGDWKWLALLGLLEPCLYFLLETYALRFTTASQAGAISALAPLLVSVGAALFLRERLSVRGLLAVGVSLIGVAVLSFGGQAQISAPAPLLGNALELGAIICAAAYMVLLKRLSERYSAWLLTSLQAFIGAVFFLPSLLLTGFRTSVSVSPLAWVAVAYLGVFVTLGAFGLYNVAISRMPASRAALAINLVPLFAIVSGCLVLDDQLTAAQLIACAIIAAGVAFGLSPGPARYRKM